MFFAPAAIILILNSKRQLRLMGIVVVRAVRYTKLTEKQDFSERESEKEKLVMGTENV